MFKTVCVIELLLLSCVLMQENVHQPQNVTWVILDSHMDVISRVSRIIPPNQWFPTLKADLGIMFNLKYTHQDLKGKYFYVCPGYKKGRNHRETCGGADQYFCASWDCVSTGDISWDPPVKNDLIQVKRSKPGIPCNAKQVGVGANKRFHSPTPCNPLTITFTREGMNYRRWSMGVTWGVRILLDGYDPGSQFTIKMVQSPLQPLIAVGPNSVLKEEICLVTEVIRPTSDLLTEQPKVRIWDNPLWSLMDASFAVINTTNPNVTMSCWLCYGVRPPYFEGIAAVGTYKVTPSDRECRWKKGSQTLQSITGQGVCIGRVPREYQQYCNNTNAAIIPNYYYVPPIGTWWACDTGLTACAYGGVVGRTGFCILVQLFPKIYVHSEDELYALYEQEGPIRRKREPITAITISVLAGLGIGGVAMGATALGTQKVKYDTLRQAIDQDFERVEDAITHLQKSLTSLSEVVLQNRRGLDLLFLQEGGLCVALREECCLYADYSGVVHDSMKKLREGLEKQKKEREERQGWFESMFHSTPWLTTLISTILGPMIILLVVLTLGPCVLNRIVQFVKDRVNDVQLMIVKQQYNIVAVEESEML